MFRDFVKLSRFVEKNMLIYFAHVYLVHFVAIYLSQKWCYFPNACITICTQFNGILAVNFWIMSSCLDIARDDLFLLTTKYKCGLKL